MHLHEYYLIKQAKQADEISTMDRLRLKFLQGEAIGRGYNGWENIEEDEDGNIKYKHTNKSRLRQGGALAMSGLGAAGGAYGGYKLTKKLSDKLGLNNNKETDGKIKKTLKALAKAGLITAGTLGGGVGGYMLGTTGAGFLNGLKDTPTDNLRTDISALANRPKNRKEVKNKMTEYLDNEGVSDKKQRRARTNAALDFMLPINAR